MTKQVRVGELEGAVMAVLWDAPAGATAREVSDRLAGPELAITTVLTMLDRLQHKGLVTRERDGRAHRYSATHSRAEFLSGLMTDALNSSDDRGAVLARFIGTIGPAEHDALRDLLGKST
jgi:predicted transcriptional regulator